ncbi:MAG TPA: P-type conjugative transfer protein TrbJ, partial [Campylobacterales bacterium]|nr:P-type conjugative transfer protein TrbJ [Campylobacterales bacterium]
QAQQYQQQIDQYINQFKSYEMMLQNIGQLPQAQWDQFTQSVNGLKDSLSFGEGLAFTASSYDADFSKLFPGYDEYLAGAAGKTTQENLHDFQAQYKQLNTSTKDTVNGALKALKVRSDDMLTDEGTMRTLSRLSTSAAGQKAAIQAANEIALHQTHQLKKLEQTIMAQANMQGEFILQKQEKEELIKAQNDAWYDKANFKKDPSKYKKTTRHL